MSWLLNNISTILVGLVVAFIVYLQARKIVHQWATKKSFCGDSCGGCGLAGLCSGNEESFLQRYKRDQMNLNNEKTP